MSKNSNATQPMKVPQQDAYYATGRRKEATARVFMFKGTGKIQLNGRELNNYFGDETLKMIVNQPFAVVESEGKFDVYCTVKGSGISAQAQAVRHGISRALVSAEEENKGKLRNAGFLTRDSREVERKKFGRKKARKSFQFSKR